MNPLRGGRAGIVVVAVLGVALALVDGGRIGSERTGALLLVHHLWQWYATLILGAICVSLGWVVLDRVGLADSQRSLSTALLGLGVGGGTVAVATLGVCAVAGVSTWTLGAALVVSTAFGVAGVLRLPALLREAAVEFREAAEPWTLVVVAVVTAFMALLATTPPTDWDALMYHLDVPAEFLRRGVIHVPLDNFHVALVGLPHMLYLHLLAFGGAEAPAMASAVFGVALGLATFEMARRWFGDLTGSVALPLLYGSTMILLVAVTARIDVTLLVWLVLAHGTWMEGIESPDRRWLVLSGSLIGLAFGIKYHAALYGALLGLGLLVDRAWRREAARRTMADAASFMAAAAIFALPWLVKNGVLLGAPLHPFGADATMTPWLVDLYARAGVAPAATVEAARALLDVRGRVDPVDLFLHPGRLTVEGEGSFYWTAPLMALSPLWALEPRNRRLALIMAPAAAYLVVVCLLFPVTNPRYLLPAFPALSIGVAAILAPRARSTLLALLVALNLVPSGIAMHRWVTARRALGHAAGVVSAADYRASHPDPGVGLLYEAAARVEAETPATERTLLLFEARGFAFDSPVLQDNLLTNWPRLAPLVAEGCGPSGGAALPFTHVLLNEGVLGYYFERGLRPETVRFDELRDWASRCLEVTWSSRGYVLLKRRDAILQP